MSLLGYEAVGSYIYTHIYLEGTVCGLGSAGSHEA